MRKLFGEIADRVKEEKVVSVHPKKAKTLKELVMKMKQRPSITVSLKSFDIFFHKNYEPEDGEGEVAPLLIESDDEDDVNNNDETANYDESHSIDVTSGAVVEEILNDSEVKTVENQEGSDEMSNVAQVTLDETTVTAVIVEKEESVLARNAAEIATEVVDNAETATEDVDNTEIDKVADEREKQRSQLLAGIFDECNILDDRYEKYVEWKHFIIPKLGAQKECDFDIHEEGTKIMESIGGIGSSKKYTDLSRDKSSKDVCRSFIAMLQLANSGNVEILHANNGHLANDTLELKLLSTRRHHEDLAVYNAPSEQNYQQRLSKVRSIASQKKCEKRPSAEFVPQPGPSGVYKRFKVR